MDTKSGIVAGMMHWQGHVVIHKGGNRLNPIAASRQYTFEIALEPAADRADRARARLAELWEADGGNVTPNPGETVEATDTRYYDVSVVVP